MLFRNRDVRWLVLALTAATAVLSFAAYSRVSDIAAGWVLATGLITTAISLVFTRARHRAIAHLSAEVDAVLHGQCTLAPSSMDEGELSILASELEKMVNRLNLTAEVLERESVGLSTALADISHQLKTPLTSLGLMVELIRGRLVERGDSLTRADIDEIVARLHAMRQLQERVQWLISALLKLARIDAGVVRLAQIEVAADEVIDAAARPLAISFDLAGVELSCERAPEARFIGDPSWSAEALGNILKNCLEHTPEGGNVRVWATQDALACRIHVEDTGPGIDEEDLPRIFDRFYRGHRDEGASTSPTDPAGVGIGLSLAQSLVTAQGGAVSARNVRRADGSVSGARFDLVFFRMNV